MPEDFKQMASEKYKKEIKENSGMASSNKDRKKMKNFALESNFAITEMMMSGRVIYGDDLGHMSTK